MNAVFATLETLAASTLFPPALALIAALLMFSLDRRDRLHALEWATGVILVLLAAGLVRAPVSGPAWSLLAPGIVAALLSRDRDSLLESECALKLVWVFGAAIALSWAGVRLLELSTGTEVVLEQWAVLELGVDPEFLWQAALPLSLMLGMVLLGGAPFHFWAADVLQGAPVWLSPLAVIVLQVTGAGWLSSRLAGIARFPEAARAVAEWLAMGAFLAFAVGAVTLFVQRRPERRVGTLASLNGGLLLAALAFARGGASAGVDPDFVARWTAHLVLALSGAAILARFVPVATGGPEPTPVLFRSHPLTGLVGLFALASLAGVPGTPGAALWRESAGLVARGGWIWVTFALCAAWLAALGAVIRQVREAFGISRAIGPAPRVPWQPRLAIWVCAVGLVVLALR